MQTNEDKRLTESEAQKVTKPATRATRPFLTQPFGYHSQNSPSKPQAVLNIRHELVHFNPVIFLFNSVSKTFPCKNVISRFVLYLKWTEALKPEIIFTSPETGNTKQKSWTTEALLRPPRKGIWKSWELGFTSHTAAGEVEGSWCPVSAEKRSCPCPVKLLPSSKRQVSQQPTKS